MSPRAQAVPPPRCPAHAGATGAEPRGAASSSASLRVPVSRWCRSMRRQARRGVRGSPSCEAVGAPRGQSLHPPRSSQVPVSVRVRRELPPGKQGAGWCGTRLPERTLRPTGVPGTLTPRRRLQALRCGRRPPRSHQSPGFFREQQAGRTHQRAVSSLYPTLLHPQHQPDRLPTRSVRKKERKHCYSRARLAGGGGRGRGWWGDGAGDSHAVHTPRHVDSDALSAARSHGPAEPPQGSGRPSDAQPSRRRPALRHTPVSPEAGCRHPTTPTPAQTTGRHSPGRGVGAPGVRPGLRPQQTQAPTTEPRMTPRLGGPSRR